MAKKTCLNSVMWQRFFPLPGWFGFTLNELAFGKSFKDARGTPTFMSNNAIAKVTTLEKGVGEGWVFVVTYDRQKLLAVDGNKADEAALIAHEAVHVWEEIKTWLQAEETDPEIDAYTIQGLTAIMLQWLAEADAFQAASEEA